MKEEKTNSRLNPRFVYKKVPLSQSQRYIFPTTPTSAYQHYPFTLLRQFSYLKETETSEAKEKHSSKCNDCLTWENRVRWKQVYKSQWKKGDKESTETISSH